MTRIICVGDVHAMDKAPVHAAESYMDDIVDMLTWIAEFAAQGGVDAVIWAGDIFHHKQPSRTSHALVLRMIQVVRVHQALGVPLFAVTGNHDISNDVLASVGQKQPLGVLFEAGLTELKGWHPTLPLFGVPWRQDWTTNDRSAEEAFAEYRKYVSGEKFNRAYGLAKPLAVTHAPIYPPTTADNQMFELVSTKAIADAMGHEGYLYYGHIHEYHGVFQVDGVEFANMGAISRGSLHEYNLEREIAVALWTMGEQEDDGFHPIAVPHKPAEEVFKIEQAAETKSERLSLDQFLSDVGSSSLDISSTGSVIEHIRGLEAPEPIKRRAIAILEEVG